MFMMRRRILIAGLAAMAALAFSAASAAPVFKVLHHFTGRGDDGGASPVGPLVVDKNGTLFGATAAGGTSGACNANGCGTVFRLLPPAAPGRAWRYRVIYNFNDDIGGRNPKESLLALNGVLYGATSGRQSDSRGAAFALTPVPGQASYARSILHIFSRGFRTNVSRPSEFTADAEGNLYGTGSTGGRNTTGGVFRLMPPSAAGAEWQFDILYNFPEPAFSTKAGVVIGKDGVLYGATRTPDGPARFGWLFSLTPPASAGGSWTHKVLHNFTDGYTGPGATLLLSRGTLYGTTSDAGFYDEAPGDRRSTIFSYRLPTSAHPEGIYHVLHRFTGSEGSQMSTRLIADEDGALYGVGGFDGAHDFGTIFKFVPRADGEPPQLNVLYNFRGALDGGRPDGGLVMGQDGTLYGVAAEGGQFGYGTVFSLKP